MKLPNTLIKHQILIIFHVETIKNRKLSIDCCTPYIDNSYSTLRTKIFHMRSYKYLKFKDPESIELTSNGLHVAEYLWYHPEKYNLVDLKQELYEQALLDGVYPDLLD